MRPPPLLRTAVSALLLAAAGRSAAAADVCTSLPFQTLSHTCSGVCPTTNHTCAAYATPGPTPCDLAGASPLSSCVTPRGSSGCVYQCFAPGKDADVLRFYILFNTTRQTRAPLATPVPTDTSMPPYESNEYIRRIGVLEDLPPFVAKVILSGGRNEDTASRGDVVDLEIDPATFSKAPNLTVIGMLNIDLGNRLPDFPVILPQNVRAVDVTNANLKQIPTSFNRLKLVQSVSFQRNLFTEVPAALTLPDLRVLYLGENLLTSYTSFFPYLEYLELADNKLQQFPSVVFNMTKLQTLKLSKNPLMAKTIFSTSQFAQLSGLQEFSIDAAVLDNSSCRADQVKPLRAQGGSVCVVSDEELAAFAAKQKASSVPPTPSGGNNNESSSPSTGGGLSGAVLAIIIVVVALVCVGAGVFGFMYVKKKRRLAAENDHEGDTSNRNFRLAKMNETAPSSEGVSGSHGVSGSGGGVSGLSQASGPFKKARHAALLLSEGSVLSSGQSLWDDDDMIARQLQLEDIEDVRVIGSGGFAIVWLVRYLPHNRLLASKRLIKDQVNRQKTMDFVMEIKLNMRLDHPNIVQLVGVAWTIETDLQALLEYMPNGDLRSHLESTARKSSKRPVWNTQKLLLAIDIAEALVYVHSFSPPLVHRDLKSRNVLLTDDMKAKVCDFGVSRFASQNNTMTSGVGTGKWLAPEVIAGSKNYDESCDIYSFGVVMSELDTHRLPYDDVDGPHGHKLPEVAVLQMVAAGQLQPTLTASCPDQIRHAALKCMSFSPADRPTAMEVAYLLRMALRDSQSPTRGSKGSRGSPTRGSKETRGSPTLGSKGSRGSSGMFV